MSSVEYLLLTIQFDFEYISKRVKLKIILKEATFSFYMCVCFAYLFVSAPHASLVSVFGSQKRVAFPWNWSHHVGAGNNPSSKYSKPLSHQALTLKVLIFMIYFKIIAVSQAWWYRHSIPVLGRQR